MKNYVLRQEKLLSNKKLCKKDNHKKQQKYCDTKGKQI